MVDPFFRGGGLPRLALWFDNPNKAAVLFGFLALIFVWTALCAHRRRTAVLLGGLSLLSWCALALTFSRGALVAFFVGQLPILFVCRRRLCRPLPIAAAVLMLALAGVAVACRGPVRPPSADASVGNRLELWAAAPRMMADAWGGWGIGTAGDVYRGWYQPLSFHERYRTLVSSHLTWLTELGVGGRIAYCTGWLLVLGLCAIRLRRRGDPLPLAVWLAFAVAATFSSVAESAVLWLVPAATAVPVLWDVVRCRDARSSVRMLAAALVGGAAVVFAVMGFGALRTDDARVRLKADAGRLIVGNGIPVTWIVRDFAVMGGPTYGRALRQYAQRAGAGNVSCGIVAALDEVPADVRRLVLCGRAADVPVAQLSSFGSLQEVRVLSPTDPAAWLDAPCAVPIAVFCGEFDPHLPADDGHSKLTVVPGNGVYLTRWPTCALGPNGGRTWDPAVEKSTVCEPRF